MDVVKDLGTETVKVHSDGWGHWELDQYKCVSFSSRRVVLKSVAKRVLPFYLNIKKKKR